MIYPLLRALFCALIFLSSAHARVIIFDIHGVLLHENLTNYVKEKVKNTLKKEHRGLRSSHPYRVMCDVLKQEQPLKDLDLPFELYKENAHYPLETFMMFSGYVHPDIVWKRTLEAIDRYSFEMPLDKQLVTALVNAIFDREEFLQSVVPLMEGIALLDATLANKEHSVYIFSNAPAPWIDLYHTQFPGIFGKLPRGKVLSSGHLSHLKPTPAAFQAICDREACTTAELFLIDDTPKNVKGAQIHGIDGVLFDYKSIDDIVDTLISKKILSAQDKLLIQQRLVRSRTTVEFGERTFFEL